MEDCEHSSSTEVYILIKRRCVNLLRCDNCHRLINGHTIDPMPLRGALKLKQRQLPPELVRRLRQLVREMDSFPTIL